MSKREKNDLNGTLGMGLDSKKSEVEVENKVGEKREKNYFVIVDNPEDNKSNGTKKDNKKEERIEIQKIDGSLNGIKTNFVTEDRVKEISDELSREYKKINKEVVKERVWENGKKITVSSYREFEEKVNRKFEPTLYLNFNKISENLKKLKKNNLYDFLNSEKLTLNFWDNQKVQEKIEDLKTNDVDASLKKTLYSFCQILVERDQIEKYNEYLEQMECLKIKDGLDEAKNRVERFKEESFESQTEIFVNKFRDVLEEEVAKNIFEEYFKDELDKEKELKEKQIQDSQEELFGEQGESDNYQGNSKSMKLPIFLIVIMCMVIAFLLWNKRNEITEEKSKNSEQNLNTDKKSVDDKKKDVTPIKNDEPKVQNKEFDIENEDSTKDVHAYCLGIGKPDVDNSKYTTTFEASLCRVNDNVVRNVKVILDKNEVEINNPDQSKKSFFYPSQGPTITKANYDLSSNILYIDLGAGGTIDDASGYISTIEQKNIDDTGIKIVDKDLKEIYGDTLRVPTVSEKEFLEQ